MRTAAYIISWIFMPLLMPVYALLAAMYIPSVGAGYFVDRTETLFNIRPEYKSLVLLLFLFFTVVVPGFFLLVLKTQKRISAFQLDDREERTTPIILTAVSCAFLAVFLMVKAPGGFFPTPVYALPWAGFVAILAVAIINRFEKISLHALGAGMLFGFFVAYFKTQEYFVFEVVIFSVLISGLVLSARMYLGKHNLRESIMGYVLGFFVVFVILTYFPDLSGKI